MKGCYLVRIMDEHKGGDEFISMIYAESFKSFFWQVDEQGYDPNSIEYKKIKLGGITLKVNRTTESDGLFNYEDYQYEFDQFSEYLFEFMDKDRNGWRSLKREDIESKIWGD